MGARLFLRVNCVVEETLADYEYELPRELIAQRPLPQRGGSRLMVLHRGTKTIEHRSFSELPTFVKPGDLVVLNDSRVLPARHFSDDGRLEFLFLEKLAPRRWRVLVKPSRKFRPGAVSSIHGIRAQAGERAAENSREIILESDVDMQRTGSMPLPPYMGRRSDAQDAVEYQTVFAREYGSIAAPTAGLHFTPEMLRQLPHAFITLHVGTGTFRPVKTQRIAEHKMHIERFSISAGTAAAIGGAKRIVAVGTTTVRVLEAVYREYGDICPVESETDIFIRRPFEFGAVDALLTNFHLPRSTLLMLVSAFAGREFILRAYAEAVRERYRFFSYGDCMLIL
ncbi:MAG: tRNA preQ1(34) S-adenosylmethionine ribosyltransferase-isomerase QueA [Verrucomicrobia bacterium]|nr:tRNA preQ1(34) S-adenosylmethionine ribosyltransferase-isomerase QueA [Verrucomicrobiota bacterium]